VRKAIERKGHDALSIVCDLSDIASVRHAAAEIIRLKLSLAGLVNNAGVLQMRATRTAHTTFVTNHLGPFALTEALIPHLPDGANIVFIASGVEDPERKPAKAAGFRGGRFISVEASARGEWKPKGSKMQGADAYATSKQCILAAARAFAREIPRLHVNAVEPGFNPGTALGRDANVFLRAIASALTLLAPLIKYGGTPESVIAKASLNEAGETGVYYDERGHPMLASALVRDMAFQDRVVAETRALLSER
jgi:NAD(P)-dependent dehydrogenase (short-subunit alcohol dehydrogenase family)